MRKLAVIMGCWIILAMFARGQAQSLLNQPESVVFDTLFERYLISNWWSGAIVQMDSNGVQSYFCTGQNCQAGLEIVDNVVYVGCSGQGVKGFDLYTGDLVADVQIPGSSLLNDVTSDTSGNLYVSDCYANKIFKIHLSDLSYSTLVNYVVWPNGLYYDRQNDRLLACGSTTRNVYAVDRNDGTLTFLTQVESGHLDGITQDNEGNIYISSQGPEAVFRYDSTFSDPPEVVSFGLQTPADIYYNKRDNILAVPNFGSTSITFVDFGLPELYWCGLNVVDTQQTSSDRLHPGEVADIYPVIGNNGYAASGVVTTVKTFNPWVMVLDSAAGFADTIPHGASSASSTPFSVSVLPSCPVPSVALLGIKIAADDGYVKEDTILIYIGDSTGFHDDMDGGLGYWRHRPAKRLFRDYWSRDETCYHSGTRSWKSGITTSYFNMTCAELVSPPFLLPTRSTLTLWHRMGAEEGDDPGTAWDGGLVYIRTMDGEKVQISPEAGYPDTSLVGAWSPLRTETPIFSGDFDWTEATFDLSSFSGVAQLVFCFTSNEANTGSGWCIDDIDVALDQENCCAGITGNVDFDPAETVDIGDLTALIGYLFVPPYEVPLCLDEANIDGIGTVDIGDLTALISYLFVPPFEAPAACP